MFNSRVGCVSATGSYTLAKFAPRVESHMPDLRSAKSKIYFDAAFGPSGTAAPVLDDGGIHEITQGEPTVFNSAGIGVTARNSYEQLRPNAQVGLQRLATMYGVPLLTVEHAKTTAMNN
jgi:hypothetical protein